MTRPLRATQLIQAPEGAVRRALGRVELWTRTASALGARAEIAYLGGGPGRTGGRLAPGDWLAVDRWPGAAGLLLAGRRLILVVTYGTADDHPVRVPAFDLLAGPVRRCQIELHTAATGAGTLVTVSCRAAAAPPPLTPLLRRPVLRAAQVLLGIATLIAREPVVVVAAAIVADGRLLAARRSADRSGPADRVDRAIWELPGGKVEPRETDRRALAREIAEELGIAVAVGERVGTDIDLGDNRVLRCFRAEPVDGAAPEPREHAELRWMGADELGSVPWLPADRDLLPALRSMLESG